MSISLSPASVCRFLAGGTSFVPAVRRIKTRSKNDGSASALVGSAGQHVAVVALNFAKTPRCGFRPPPFGFAKLQSAHMDGSGAENAESKAAEHAAVYDKDDVNKFWGALGNDGRLAEQEFLKEDLIFPLMYGGALALSLGWVLSMSGLSWSPWLIVLPVVIGVVGDWAENLIQLEQLQRYIDKGKDGLDPGAILRSSIATDVKLAGVLLSSLLLLALVAIFLKRNVVVY